MNKITDFSNEEFDLIEGLRDGKVSFKSIKKQEIFDLLTKMATAATVVDADEDDFEDETLDMLDDLCPSVVIALQDIAKLQDEVENIDSALTMAESDITNTEDTLYNFALANKDMCNTIDVLTNRLNRLEMFHRKHFNETQEEKELQNAKLDMLRNEIRKLSYSRIPGHKYGKYGFPKHKEYKYTGTPLKTTFATAQRHMDAPDPNVARPMKFEEDSLFGQRGEWEDNHNDPSYAYNKEEYMDD